MYYTVQHSQYSSKCVAYYYSTRSYEASNPNTIILQESFRFCFRKKSDSEGNELYKDLLENLNQIKAFLFLDYKCMPFFNFLHELAVLKTKVVKSFLLPCSNIQHIDPSFTVVGEFAGFYIEKAKVCMLIAKYQLILTHAVILLYHISLIMLHD